MEINVNVRIDLGDKTMGLVGRMLGAIAADSANTEAGAEALATDVASTGADGGRAGADGCTLATDVASTGADGGRAGADGGRAAAEKAQGKTADPTAKTAGSAKGKAKGGKGKKAEAAAEAEMEGKAGAEAESCARGAGETPTPPVENLETAANVGNEMPMDDGSRKAEALATDGASTGAEGGRAAAGGCALATDGASTGAEGGQGAAAGGCALATDGASTGADGGQGAAAEKAQGKKADPTVSAEAPYGTSIRGIACKRDVNGGHDELVVKMREAMSDCWTRFIGEDYKNRVTEPKYKRYYQPLKSHFMRLANTLGAKKPSELGDDNLRTFIMEVDLLSPNPETGEIEKKNFF